MPKDNTMISLLMLVDEWKRAGHTDQQINDHLDMKILGCGVFACKSFLNSKGTFRLTKFYSLALKWSYAILLSNKHVPSVKDCDIDNVRNELSKWVVDQNINEETQIVSVLAMIKLCEIQVAGKPYKIK